MSYLAKAFLKFALLCTQCRTLTFPHRMDRCTLGDCSGMSVFASAREGEDEVVLLFCLGFRRMPVATAAAGLDEWSGALPLEPVRRGMPLGATEPTPIASGGFGWLLPPFADLGFEAVGDCEVSSSTV